ncbi:hypothetical protein DNTS_026588 [Danionella cerebrum]|uniref:IF rod domain-containing protein n=1 Tax=Danionella cerebrum TaxID=2873325 RepID=A0A553RK33_9TELE|nr:hypothetical protein DNTS_026588 [Danionella translucida]TRZ02543.1 hypothetical protein DNTS_026588 [Danionella translucida]
MLHTKKTTKNYSHSAIGLTRRTPISRSGMVMREGRGFNPGLNTPITSVKINKNLLEPMKLEIDPSFQAIRAEEKEQIKILNNRFATFINRVCHLEQQNKILETKWNLLQQQTSQQSHIDKMFQNYIAGLHRYLDGLANEKVRLESGLQDINSIVRDFKIKYEEEIDKKSESDNDFVVLKKDADAAYLKKMELQGEIDTLTNDLHFHREMYEAELGELRTQIKDKSVVVEMDNSRNLDMEAIVAEVRAQYEDVAGRSRAEAESWYRQKYEEMQLTASQHGDDLKNTKAEISEYNRRITRLQSEIDAIKAQHSNYEGQIKEAEKRGEVALKEARARVHELEAALVRTKHDMARQVREFQSLMNIKLALDIEIATYRKLLEGEENRLYTSYQTHYISSVNSANFDLESSRTSVSSQSPVKDIRSSGLVKQEVVSGKGEHFSSVTTVTRSSSAVSSEKNVLSSVGSKQLMGSSVEDVFE